MDLDLIGVTAWSSTSAIQPVRPSLAIDHLRGTCRTAREERRGERRRPHEANAGIVD